MGTRLRKVLHAVALFMQHPIHFACLPQELKACHEEMRVSSSTTPRKKAHKEAEEKSVGWVEVLTDTLLGLLSRMYARYLRLGMRYETGICTFVISVNGAFKLCSFWCRLNLKIHGL